MQDFSILRESSPDITYRVQRVIDAFDLQKPICSNKFEGSIDFPEDWQIGVIVGRSGTGKTTISKHLFSEYTTNDIQYSKSSFLDDFDSSLSIDEITTCLSNVGFSSPPQWLKPYESLSNGEKMRVDLARCLLSNKDIIVFDEFTSVVDRQVAMVTSLATSKAIRRTNKKFIAVTCHYDVLEWLNADWIFNTDTYTMQVPEKKKHTLSLTSTQQSIVRYGTFLRSIII